MLWKKSCSSQACNFIKQETLSQVFSWEFCEISKKIFFTEHVLAIASINITTLVKIILFSSTCPVQLTCQVFPCWFCEVSKNTFSCRTPPVAASEYSRNLEFEQKRTDQNFITQNLRHGKEYYISKKKALLKQCQKEVIYDYILAFVGWRSIFWEMIGSGGYILAGGGYWWMVVNGSG